MFTSYAVACVKLDSQPQYRGVGNDAQKRQLPHGLRWGKNARTYVPGDMCNASDLRIKGHLVVVEMHVLTLVWFTIVRSIPISELPKASFTSAKEEDTMLSI